MTRGLLSAGFRIWIKEESDTGIKAGVENGKTKYTHNKRRQRFLVEMMFKPIATGYYCTYFYWLAIERTNVCGV
jgi:hypothetical protein